MVKKAGRSAILLLLFVMIASLSLAGCSSNGDSSAASNSDSNQATNSTKADTSVKKEKSEVKFWYLWQGAEAEYVESLISDFNKSQDQYTVKGLSVPDVQKVVVALSSGDGPDITDNFSSNTASYADKGILEPLDDYIQRDNYDVSDFVPGALRGGQFDGKTYALPININFYMMFYNKKMFAEQGIAAPPKTADELLDDAVKLTKVNSDGSIDTLGFPDYPLVYYINPMSFALGGDFISSDGKLTPDNAGTVAAIDLMKRYRDQFGVDNVTKFSSSAKYLDATDPFISGKQAIRFDGPWFGNTVKNVLKVDLDYGVAPLPGPQGEPGMAGGGEISSSTFFIAKNAKNKEGAWAFMSWLMSRDNMTKFNSMFGNLPARTSCYDDPSLQNIPDFKAFAEAAVNPNLKSFPAIPQQAEYGKIVSDEFELAVNGKKSAEDAMSSASKKANALK